MSIVIIHDKFPLMPMHVSAESPSNISPNPSEVIFEVYEPYNNPFWDFRNGGEKKKRGIIPKILPFLSLLRWSHALSLDQYLK